MVHRNVTFTRLATAFTLFAFILLGAAATSVAAAPAAQSEASDEETRLQISHICMTPGAMLEVHFVLIDPPQNVTSWGSVLYTMTVPNGQTVNGDAPFERVMGNVAHYTDLASSYGPGEYTMMAAHVIVDGVQYDLRNPGPRQVGACTPTSVELAALKSAASQSGPWDTPMFPVAVAIVGLIVLLGLVLRFQSARDAARRREHTLYRRDH